MSERRPYREHGILRSRVAAPMKHAGRTWKRWIAPLALMAVAAGTLAFGMSNAGGAIPPSKIYGKVAIPLLRLLAYLAVGLFVGQMLESLGWTVTLGRWVRPVTRWAHLRDESGAAFVSSFVSGIVANTLLMQCHTEGKLTRTELTLTYLLNSGLPLYLVHLPTTLFIVASLAGTAGIAYVAIGFAAASLRSTAVLAYCRYVLPGSTAGTSSVEPVSPTSRTAVARQMSRQFLNRFLRLILYTLPVYVLVFLINEWGAFTAMRRGAGAWISGQLFPVEAAGVVIGALVAEFSAGMAAAGALMQAGSLTLKQTVLALIIGSIVATPIRAVRHQLPTHAGIFSLGLGSKLLLVSQTFRIVSLIVVTVPFLIWA